MSYARWSNSVWYAFYNINGCLSLWYDMEHTTDWPYENLVDFMESDDPVQALIDWYKCTEDEAKEAIVYIDMFIEDYDPADVENYAKEFADFMLKLKEFENKE